LATLSANHTFTASDAGTFQFTGNTFGTAGTQSLTATDINSNSVTGTQAGIIINGGIVTKLVFSTQPAGAVYKTAFTTQPVMKTKDSFGNDSTNGLGASLIVSLALTTGSGPLAGNHESRYWNGGWFGNSDFFRLQINKAENGDVLTANASGFPLAQIAAPSTWVRPR